MDAAGVSEEYEMTMRKTPLVLVLAALVSLVARGLLAQSSVVGPVDPLRWPRLSRGRHTLTFLCLGKNAASSGYNLGVDNVILARTGPAGWAKASAVRPPRVPESVSGLSQP
jgi:hypothetical protein